MRSAKSFAAHLTGVCAAVESEDAAAINRVVQQWLNGPKPLERPGDVPAGHRGKLTIADVHSAADPQEYLQRIREWARASWDAWSTHHALAREWIKLAQGSHVSTEERS